MVHEGDRRRMAEAIAESARQRQGYGTIGTPPLSAQAQVYLLAPTQWDQQDFNPLEPYGGPPDYPEWAGQVYNRPAQPTAECFATLRPMMVVIHEKQVGQSYDTATAFAAWLLTGISALVILSAAFLVTD